jgi:hypothetical protein
MLALIFKKHSRFALALASAAVIAACATPRSRIKRHQAAFDSYPPAIRQDIRDGKVDIGFTREQVELALGRPDRTYTRKTAAAAQEVWAYGLDSGGPRFGLGLGMGSGRGRGFLGGGVGVATGVGAEPDRGARTRIVFQDGVVVSVEKRQN